MEPGEILLEVYDKRCRATSSIYATKVSNNVFRMTENDLVNCKLTFGTEFETRINKEGKYEIVRILKESSFITRRFFLNAQFNAEEYRVLGDEIVKWGGFWQVDFGGIATINVPPDSGIDIDKIFETFNFKPGEIVD